jgi:hypothetical protein
MPGIMDHDVDLAALGDDLLDGGVGRELGQHVEFDRTQVDAVPADILAISAAFLAFRPATSRMEA